MPFNQTAPDDDLKLDPIQGFDVEVNSISATGAGSALVGRFTSVMFKVVNQTETYLPLNQRIARQLDGELLFVWAAEQGMLHPQFLATSFGAGFSKAMDGEVGTSTVSSPIKSARYNKIPRSERFHLVFRIDLGLDVNITADNTAAFYNSRFTQAEHSFQLSYCRVDTYSFGVTSGRNIVANSWQGTAEQLKLLDSTT